MHTAFSFEAYLHVAVEQIHVIVIAYLKVQTTFIKQITSIVQAMPCL